MTRTSAVVASAPGKLMIAGEYAVLEGAEAIVAAVGRRAIATLRPEGTDSSAIAPASGAITADPPAVRSPEVVATRRRVEARLGVVLGELTVDTGALEQNGQKLGLGSSAAKAAATAAAIALAHGVDLTLGAERERILADALVGHRVIAPQGSGADVAAAVLGGYLRFRKLGEGVETHVLTWPESLRIQVVWSRASVRTSDMLEATRGLARRDPSRYRACMRSLSDQSEELVSCILASELSGIIEGFHGYGTAMGALGKAAGARIIDDTCERVRSLARAHGGAAKPSGAGGGDVTLAIFSSAEAADSFATQCAHERFEVLSLELGVAGVRGEEQ